MLLAHECWRRPSHSTTRWKNSSVFVGAAGEYIKPPLLCSWDRNNFGDDGAAALASALRVNRKVQNMQCVEEQIAIFDNLPLLRRQAQKQ